MKLHWNAKDLTGKIFGRLTVTEYSHTKSMQLYWNVICECGVKKAVKGGHLTGGKIISCGCYISEITSKRNFAHGKAESDEYKIWCKIKERCYNPKCKAFPNYGGRGILMSEEWRHSFEKFFNAVGPRPSRKYSIDRINNDLGYYTENCRWATDMEQNNNSRQNKKYLWLGEKRTIPQIGRLEGLDISKLRGRVDRGMGINEAVKLLKQKCQKI